MKIVGKRIKMSAKCDQIGRFLNDFWRQIFFQKNLRYWVTFWVVFKALHLRKTAVTTFWQLLENFGLLFVSTFGHTGPVTSPT